MGGEFAAEHEHVGLGGAAPFLDEARDFGDRLGGRSRQRAGQRVEDVGLDRPDDGGVEPRGITWPQNAPDRPRDRALRSGGSSGYDSRLRTRWLTHTCGARHSESAGHSSESAGPRVPFLRFTEPLLFRDSFSTGNGARSCSRRRELYCERGTRARRYGGEKPPHIAASVRTCSRFFHPGRGHRRRADVRP